MHPSARIVGAAVVVASVAAAWGMFRKSPNTEPLPIDTNQPVMLRRETANPVETGAEILSTTAAANLLGEIEPAGEPGGDPWQVAPLPEVAEGWTSVKTVGLSASPSATNSAPQPPPHLPASYPSTGLPAFQAPPRRTLDPQRDVFEPAVTSYAPTPVAPRTGHKVHKVRDGDTLSSLAKQYLGNALRFREIYEANRDRLQSPDLLPIGTMLRIPGDGDPHPPTADTAEPADPLVPIGRDQLPGLRPIYPSTRG